MGAQSEIQHRTIHLAELKGQGECDRSARGQDGSTDATIALRPTGPTCGHRRGPGKHAEKSTHREKDVPMIDLNWNCVSTPIRSRGCAALAVLTVAMTSIAAAHHPDRQNQPVRQRVDLIGPLGNRLDPGYRRVYNRPTYWGGKIAYLIAPTSQEAMAWHRAEHSGAYEAPKKHMRLEQHYFYPKPYHALTVGPRRATDPASPSATNAPEAMPEMLETEPLMPSVDPPSEPQLELPEIEPNDEVGSASDAGEFPVWDVHVSSVEKASPAATIAELVSESGK
ncbi:hypothetical protein Enr13x_31350 [Stieleria neptunia]|uniref:Uncharacterized protein n=1 Tax=Stieleria neptunia TaxID=2527979 RepID=A0A518HR03_9BACT|nr:hypothetical protein [Stieleria neptunia]QDV43280.1 hypothetical protein Enr13x_31350 [Stieleria neptunia]